MLSPSPSTAFPNPTVNMRGHVSGTIVLFVLLFLALAVFLIFPMETIALQAWVPALQNQMRVILSQSAPFVLVAALGAIVGLAEISSTFPNYPREALQTGWARILILVNALAAGIAFWIARVYAPGADLALTIVAVGIGFQALIRTRFTLAKQIGGTGSGDVTLNLGWLYDQFQNLCKTQIALELMNGRRTAVTRLLERFPTLAELYEVSTYTILSRATLTPQEEKTRLAELDQLMKPQAPTPFARASMALMILETGGQAYVDLLLSQPSAAAPTITPEQVVKQLIEKHSLAELTDLAKQLLTAPEDLKYIEATAKASTGISEADQKAALAHLLVERVGARELAKRV